MADKLITYTIPCYNSAEYMDHCVESILACSASDIEIVIVDDGSTKDSTFEKAQEWERRHPEIVKAVHQENGGHGAAVMKGLENASGLYFKVVDSDDWVDNDANVKLLAQLREFEEHPIDLMVVNYVYEHTVDNTQQVMNYHGILPQHKVFRWEECGRLPHADAERLRARAATTHLLRGQYLRVRPASVVQAHLLFRR